MMLAYSPQSWWTKMVALDVDWVHHLGVAHREKLDRPHAVIKLL